MKKKPNTPPRKTQKRESPLARFRKLTLGDILLRVGVVVILLAVLGTLAILANKAPENGYTLADDVAQDGSDAAENSGYFYAVVTKVLYDDAVISSLDQHGEEVGVGKGISEDLRIGMQQLEIRFTSGPHKGQTAQMENHLTTLSNVDVGVGDEIVVRYTDYGNGNTSIFMYSHSRVTGLLVLLAVFCAAILLIGGKKGVQSLLGLFFMLACFWYLLIPLVMRGYNILFITIVITALTAAASLLLLNGFTKKTYAAILGCVVGVAIAGFCVMLVNWITPITGFNMEETERLLYSSTKYGMKISGLLVCGVLISSLGAVMDVAMSIASSIQEVHDANPELSAGRLFKSGMNVGKDAMGTMSNTLILAIFGSSLNTFILAIAYDMQMTQLLSTDFIVVELLQGMAGTIGVIMTIPFVALLASRIIARKS
ncbi:MAG: YibE/F family protein [Oscillospiraceae bacterium]|jgi:uncharacterized membrane protein|nr:YibE/F family protein [Oscillospiraceae bacterium]